MSRGAGRIQRAIEGAFRQNPSASYSVEELVAIAYPGVNQVEKKHRVAVLRAAAAAAEACGWWYGKADRPGHPMIYGNPLDVRSYATWNMRRDFLEGGLTPERLTAALDDPGAWPTRWEWVQPGGAWWQHVQINQARRDGRHEEAEEIRERLNAGVAAKLSALRR